MPGDILNYAETVGAKTLDVLRKSYDDQHERVYKLAAILSAGAGAVGAYTLERLANGQPAQQWLPLGLLSCSWFLVVAYVVISGASSKLVSPGNGPRNIMTYYDARVPEFHSADNAGDLALLETRRAELDLVQARITRYEDACAGRCKALDMAYKAIAISPVAPVAAVALLRFFA